ncbi:hypothetical protein HDU92_003753 [Lobulomyces angularis]|nr:hypothetical protein HDU92_003753 [Lobulomyces angularis]
MYITSLLLKKLDITPKIANAAILNQKIPVSPAISQGRQHLKPISKNPNIKVFRYKNSRIGYKIKKDMMFCTSNFEKFSDATTNAITKPLIKNDTNYPFSYYQITLKRGVIGLSRDTKEAVAALGLVKRFQVVFRRVEAKHAGLILKVKELVDVKLVNSIPKVLKIEKGYQKANNTIGVF